MEYHIAGTRLAYQLTVQQLIQQHRVDQYVLSLFLAFFSNISFNVSLVLNIVGQANTIQNITAAICRRMTRQTNPLSPVPNPLGKKSRLSNKFMIILHLSSPTNIAQYPDTNNILMLRLTRLVRHTATVKAPHDYYKTLGVDKGATQEQIKFAYYKLSQLSHPSIDKKESAKKDFQLLNEAYVILADPKSRRAYDLLHRIDPHTFVTPPVQKERKPVSGYQKSFEQKNAEFRVKYNIDEFGRFKGGLPNKRKGVIRGTSLQQPNQFFSHVVHQDVVDAEPDYQYVTPQVAESFKKFHQDQRRYRSFKWPWFNVSIDYQFFQGKRFFKIFDAILGITVVFYVIPTLLMVSQRSISKAKMLGFRGHEIVDQGSKPNDKKAHGQSQAVAQQSSGI